MSYTWTNIDTKKLSGNYSVAGFPSANKMKAFNNSRVGRGINEGAKDVARGYTDDLGATSFNKSVAAGYGAYKSGGKLVERQ